MKYDNLKKHHVNFEVEIIPSIYNQEELKNKGVNLNQLSSLGKLVKIFGSNKGFLLSNPNHEKSFSYWISKFKNWESQKISNYKCNLNPKKSRLDENKNIIEYFNEPLLINKKFVLSISFDLKSYEIILSKNKSKISNREYKRYIASEPFLEQTEEITNLAKEITKNQNSNFDKAKEVFHWCIDNIKYKWPPEQRGVITTFKNREGDCGEFSYLFITLCRSLKIPARSITGWWASTNKEVGPHAWAEFFDENYGWVPVDTSVAQELKVKKDKDFIKFMNDIKNPMNPNYYFGNLDNNRLILSKGNNIKITPTNPSYNNLLNSMGFKEGKLLFMQPSAPFPYINTNIKGLIVFSSKESLKFST